MTTRVVDLTAVPAVVGLTHKCGFCMHGKHQDCALGVYHPPPHVKYPQGVVWVCGCDAPECDVVRRKCTYCNNRATEEVDPLTWRCFDVDSCHAIVEERREANPFTAQLREIKERVNMAKIEGQKEKAAKKAAAPKVGACACCGGETKGGSFLPGHDARFVSTLVGKAEAANFTKKAADEGRKALKDAGASDKLNAKFEKSLSLATEKRDKKDAAAKEKAAAKAEAAKA